MTQGFDKDYWEAHWQRTDGPRAGQAIAPNPYLAREIGDLTPGTALDAGCGEGAEALWLAAAGWQVTAADISSEVLARAAARAAASESSTRIRWVEADLSAWAPDDPFDLVATHYAHPAMPQLVFYQRIAHWVAPGGTLLIVGHLHGPHTDGHGHEHRHGHGDHPPQEASVTVADVTAGLDTGRWHIVTAEDHVRTPAGRAGGTLELHDVVVRAVRRP